MARTLTTDVENKVRAYVRTFADDIPVSAVYVFGSQAEGTAGDASDIDVAVISPPFGGNSFATGAYLQNKLWDSPFKNIDVVGYSPDDFADNNSPLVAEIKAHGVLVK